MATDNLIQMASAFAKDVVGSCLPELAEEYPNLLVLNADLANANRTIGFVEKYPERSFNTGIAEQNMISFAAGLAHEGFKPLACTMATFLSMRACEQIRTDVCYGGLSMILLSTYAGFSGSIQGATHTGLEDCAIINGMSRTVILEPGDPWMVRKMLKAAMESDDVVYIRTGGEAAQPIYGEDYEYEIGKALIPREGDDGAFIVCGTVVSKALEAAEILKKEEGVNIRVVDMHTVKPVDADAVVAAAKTGRIVCAQDHNISGGLGYNVAVALAESGLGCKFKILGAPNKFVPLATPEFLYHKFEYDAEGLAKNMKAFL